MKSCINRHNLCMAILLFVGTTAAAQNSQSNSITSKKTEMKTYVIEREIPGAGKLNEAELKSISQKSCSVLKEIGTQIQWVHSYVTGNKIYCIYKAENEELVREHAKKGGFPANSIQQVATVISPATAD